VRKNYREHILILIWACSAFFRSEVRGADNTLLVNIKKVDSLNEIAFTQKRFDVARSLNNLFVAENLASTINYQKGLGVAYLYQAGIFHQNGYEKKALSTYYRALQLFQNLKDTFNIARASKEIAASLQSNGKTEEAVRLYNMSLGVYTALHKRTEIANIKNSIGLIELNLENIQSARKYFLEALEISIAEKYDYGEKKSYYNLGLLEEKLDSLVKARSYFNKSLVIDIHLRDKYGEALNQLELAAILNKEHKQEASIILTKQAYMNAAVIPAYNLLKEAATRLIKGYRKKGDNLQAGQWQDSLSVILQAQIDNEKEYAINFIDVIKNQDLLKINAENETLKTKRLAKEQFLIITVGTFILIIVAVLAVLALVNYQRQRFFGKELKKTNTIIEKNANSLDLLNKEISKQNELLEEDNRTKSKLLSIISHDLRTPLVNTKGILNLVNQGMIPPEETDKLMQQLESQYQSTTSLLDNLLFWIKGQVSEHKNEKIDIHFYQLIKGLEDEQRIQLAKKNIRLENNVDRSVVIVAEKEMVRIIFRNLISNAIKFTPDHGVVELDSKIGAGYIYLTVKDWGIGMTKETIEKVNAKQYYTTKGTSLEKGSGFGLMLCSDLVLRLGGEMIIESELGKGSAFTVKIPYSE
jgi:signal transduction histidine kinase